MVLWRPGRLLLSLPHQKIASPARALQLICTRRGGVPEQAPATGRLDYQVESDVWPVSRHTGMELGYVVGLCLVAPAC
jgi:hypothetical protein